MQRLSSPKIGAREHRLHFTQRREDAPIGLAKTPLASSRLHRSSMGGLLQRGVRVC
jgi:hypothetical protein